MTLLPLSLPYSHLRVLLVKTSLLSQLVSWLAFAAKKVVEVDALAKALAEALSSRRSSPRVTNQSVQKALSSAADLKGSDHRRATEVTARLDNEQKKLNLPILPTTTIGSFPQTVELSRVCREYKAKKISDEDYVKAIKEEIKKVVDIQEDLDIDVLVHGEPEHCRETTWLSTLESSCQVLHFTANGWVQSYGSRCVKPPIIF
ncbi:5-methyltetrahydropteroyltriglutamate--homocysteine methyltransferase 2 [Raphanus sativus]|nr:5-methyltetrahydropteroyltriglutamate--homocysteine methyltransferase 2 [Raphanus sativus]